MVEQNDPLIGFRLGNYVIRSVLGRGGMGVVYCADHATLPSKAAVKVLLDEFARDADLVKRFLDEAHVAASINDPHVVRVFDAGQLPDGRPYLVMELLEGRNLHVALREEGALPLVRGLKILRQVAGAVGVVHSFGILHRDLKPENVHLGKDSKGADLAKVLDFGLAKTQGMQKGVTSAGTVVGTPEYMSPEQAQSQELDKRSDIYSFGCIAYATVTGTPPFDAETAISLLLKHVSEPAPDCRLKRGDAPESVSKLIARCMAKKPDDRPSSMEEVAQSLDAIIQELEVGFGSGATVAVGISGTALSQPSTQAATTSAVASTSMPAEFVATKPARAKSALLIPIVLATTLLGGGVAGFLFMKKKAPTTSTAPYASTSASTSTSASVVINEDHNPFTLKDKAAIAAGGGLWSSQCSRCHGEKGDGKGEKIPEGAHPRAFNDVVIPEGALDAYYFPIVRHGVTRGGGEVMPPFQQKLSVKETWQVITFINSLRPKMKQIDIAQELAEGAPADENTCVLTGGKLYAAKCTQCHGEDLTGEGPASRVLPEPPTDLKSGNWNSKLKKPDESDYTYVFRIITTGTGGEYMGSFSNLSRFERWSLAKYVLSVRNPGGSKVK